MYVYRARIGHRGAVKRKGGIRYQLRNFSIPPLTWRFELTRIGDGVAPVVFRHFDAVSLSLLSLQFICGSGRERGKLSEIDKRGLERREILMR